MAKSQTINSIQDRAARLQELYGLSADEAVYLSGIEHGWDAEGEPCETWRAPSYDEAGDLNHLE